MFTIAKFEDPNAAQIWLNDRYAEGWLVHRITGSGSGSLWIIMSREPL